MVDGSHLSFEDNISYTKYIASLAHRKDMLVEAELGRLSGTEDDLTVAEYEARLTDINQVSFFLIAIPESVFPMPIQRQYLNCPSVNFRHKSSLTRLALMLWQCALAMSMGDTRHLAQISGLICLR